MAIVGGGVTDRPVLVTGGAGFIGSNIADRLVGDGHSVLLYDSLERPGVEDNLAWLRGRHGGAVTHVAADVRDRDALDRAVRECGLAVHLAAQVAVTTSLDDPREDFDVNAGGTFNLLESLRLARRPIPLVVASTNKVYGSLNAIPVAIADDRYRPGDETLASRGIGETQPLDFRTPYGCSKGAADQYALDYARSYGLPVTVMRMSCIYGRRQMGTEDQGWVAHFVRCALEDQPITVYGDGCQVRDILHIDDAVDAYVAALGKGVAAGGSSFNLGGGPANAVAVNAVIGEIARCLGRRLDVRNGAWRADDQRWYVSDTRKVRTALDLPAPLPWREGLRRLIGWMQDERPAMPMPAAAVGA